MLTIIGRLAIGRLQTRKDGHDILQSYSSQILCAILAILSHKEQTRNKRLLGFKKELLKGWVSLNMRRKLEKLALEFSL